MSPRRIVVIAAALLAVAAPRAFGQVVRVSVSTDGTPADASSSDPSASADGRFVAFVSSAGNLVPGDMNGFDDVFVRDRDTDADGVFDEPGAVSTVRIQVPGVDTNGPSREPCITPDGRYVVFVSSASSLFASAGNGPLAYRQVFRWERLTGEIRLVSRTTEGVPLLNFTAEPVVSADGNTIVFVSLGNSVIGGESGSRDRVFRRNEADGTLVQVSEPVPPTSGDILHLESPSVSDDGRVIAYTRAVIELGRYMGTTYVHGPGQPVRTYPGVFPQLSADGQFLALLDSTARQIHLASEQILSVGAIGAPISGPVALSRSGRYFVCPAGLVDFAFGSAIGAAGTFAGETQLVSTVTGFEPMRTISDIVVEPMAARLDQDADGLNDHWEAAFGLSSTPGSGAIGVNGPGGDPDADGFINVYEQIRGSNPRDALAYYVAEGSTGEFFSTRYAIANPGSGVMVAAVRIETSSGEMLPRVVTLPARSRVTLDSRALGLGNASFSAIVEATSPAAVDRLTTWGDPGAVPYGSHADRASRGSSQSWFLAEGTTVLGFQLFYLLHNPVAATTTATIRFLLPSGSPIVRTYQLPPRSRTTVYVNTIPGLESTDVSAEIYGTYPIAVERAMYRSAGGQTFALGHAASPVEAPATTWLFAEGATGSFFDTYLLLANPYAQPASVQVEYQREASTPVTRTYTVRGGSRLSVFVDGEPGLAAASFGMRVTSTAPIVAERAMYWAGGFFDYYEGHASTGATQTGSRWTLAESEQGGRNDAQSFVLIANTGPATAWVAVRSLPDAMDAPRQIAAFPIAGRSRVTVPLSALPNFRRGGIEVVEDGTTTGALVVEGAIYWNRPGQPFAAGANWPATLIP